MSREKFLLSVDTVSMMSGRLHDIDDVLCIRYVGNVLVDAYGIIGFEEVSIVVTLWTSALQVQLPLS